MYRETEKKNMCDLLYMAMDLKQNPPYLGSVPIFMAQSSCPIGIQ